MRDDRTCIVVTIPAETQTLRLKTSDGEVDIEVVPLNKRRTKLAIRAPRTVRVWRQDRDPKESDNGNGT